MTGKLANTTKDIGLLKQLYDNGQLQISAEFQRNAVWPRKAKAYLIDTILTGNPIPVLYFQRSFSSQTNRVEYIVVDGQQRLNAIFQFLENRFMLTESDPSTSWHRKNWRNLNEADQLRILSYDLVVQELSGFSKSDVREMFQRMNRYVVALNPQERRHANDDGEFKKLAEEIGSWDFWTINGVVSGVARARMKADELAAELIILLNEGPQDKKESVDFYYRSFREQFEAGNDLKEELLSHLGGISAGLPALKSSRLRRPANIYAIVGALSELNAEDVKVTPGMIARLEPFGRELALPSDQHGDLVAEYAVAQSRQTDNLKPRRARIDILKSVISQPAAE